MKRLTTKEAAAYLRLSESKLNGDRSKGRGPRYVRLGGKVFYRECDLDAWVDGNTVETEDSRKSAA